MENFRDLIDKWPSTKELADDLRIKHETVKKWRQRGAIGPNHWPYLIECGKRRKIRLTAEMLMKMRGR